MDHQRFRALQGELVRLWPALTLRTAEHDDRVAVVLSSISLPAIPEVLHPVLPAYEERYLFYVLSLARAPRSRVVYVTSLPIAARLLDYYIGLVPGVDRDDCRRRLTVLTLGDSRPIPLTAKVLERPRFIERLRSAIGSSEAAVLLPFLATELEAELSVRLGVPLYGPDPSLSWLGTKTGSREAFRRAGVAHPPGIPVADAVEAVAAARTIVSESGCRRLVVKLDLGASGIGNALIDVPADPAFLEAAVRALRPEVETLTADEFFEQLAEQGGVVEAWVEAEEVHSPSVQLRASPVGEVEVLSTHDQILGGPSGLSYLGCRFPAAAAYRSAITEAAVAVGRVLADAGVVGRFAIDFLATRAGDAWDIWAIEINLRNGGTTHPAITLLALTEAQYDERRGVAVSRGIEKHYVATDHLESPAYRKLTVDDVLDLVEEHHLGWDGEREVGVAFHLLSAVAVAGLVGVTAIGDTPAEADDLLARVRRTLDAAAVSAG